MSGNATHAARPGIMNDPAQHLALLVILRGRDFAPPGRWRQEASVRHAQWREYFLGAICIQCASSDVLNQRSQRNEIGVAVEKPRTRRIVRRFRKRQSQGGVTAVPRRGQIDVRAQAGEVSQQVPNSNIFFAVLREFGDIFRHRIVQPDFAFLYELHHRSGCGHNFRKRGDIENRVHRHGFLARLKGAVAESLAVDHLPVVPDQQDSAGSLIVVDGITHDRIKNSETGYVNRLCDHSRCGRRRLGHAG